MYLALQLCDGGITAHVAPRASRLEAHTVQNPAGISARRFQPTHQRTTYMPPPKMLKTTQTKWTSAWLAVKNGPFRSVHTCPRKKLGLHSPLICSSICSYICSVPSRICSDSGTVLLAPPARSRSPGSKFHSIACYFRNSTFRIGPVTRHPRRHSTARWLSRLPALKRI
jgi:hypothetical protein